jgi:hypothetical protein
MSDHLHAPTALSRVPIIYEVEWPPELVSDFLTPLELELRSLGVLTRSRFVRYHIRSCVFHAHVEYP